MVYPPIRTLSSRQRTMDTNGLVDLNVACSGVAFCGERKRVGLTRNGERTPFKELVQS